MNNKSSFDTIGLCLYKMNGQGMMAL